MINFHAAQSPKESLCQGAQFQTSDSEETMMNLSWTSSLNFQGGIMGVCSSSLQGLYVIGGEDILLPL